MSPDPYFLLFPTVNLFFHTLDGQFTPGGEWSNVTPAAYISTGVGTAIPVLPFDAAANSLLFAGLGQTRAYSDLSMFVLYDFLPRTVGTPFGSGEIFASITFPITLPITLGQQEAVVSVLFQGSSMGFVDIFVDLNLDGNGDVPASLLGISGDADFGHSPLSSTPHLILELDVPLRILPGFGTPGGPIPGNGINPATGLYDPDPAFWSAAARPDGAGLQPASAAMLTINPDGSTTVQPVPEPSSAALLLASLGVLGARRRRS